MKPLSGEAQQAHSPAGIDLLEAIWRSLWLATPCWGCGEETWAHRKQSQQLPIKVFVLAVYSALCKQGRNGFAMLLLASEQGPHLTFTCFLRERNSQFLTFLPFNSTLSFQPELINAFGKLLQYNSLSWNKHKNVPVCSPFPIVLVFSCFQILSYTLSLAERGVGWRKHNYYITP